MSEKVHVFVVLDTGERILCSIPRENGKHSLAKLADCVFGKTGVPNIALKFFWRGEQLDDFLPLGFPTSGEVIHAIVESPRILKNAYPHYDGDYLEYAVLMDRVDAVKRIIEENDDPEDILNEPKYNGLPILSLALSPEMAELLVAAGANPEEFVWPLHRGDGLLFFEGMMQPSHFTQKRLRRSQMLDLGANPDFFDEAGKVVCPGMCDFDRIAHLSQRVVERGCEKCDCSEVSSEDEIQLEDLKYEEDDEEDEEDSEEDDEEDSEEDDKEIEIDEKINNNKRKKRKI